MHSCNVDCAVAFHAFFEGCRSMIDSLFDVAANDTARDHSAQTLLAFEALCARMAPAPLFHKIEAQRRRHCTVNTSGAVSRGSVGAPFLSSSSRGSVRVRTGTSCAIGV